VASGMQELRRIDSAGRDLETRTLSLRCSLLDAGRFRELVMSIGYEVEALYGDYSRASYEESQSPYMIWVLKKLTSH